MTANCIRVIKPYQWNGLWVFDDEAVGLEREAFVSGADEFITALADPIPFAKDGFLLLFSEHPFPGHTLELHHLEPGEMDFGNYYVHQPSGKEAWLCPALLLYFHKAPERLYAQALPQPRN